MTIQAKTARSPATPTARRTQVGLRGVGELAGFLWAALRATFDLFFGARTPKG